MLIRILRGKNLIGQTIWLALLLLLPLPSLISQGGWVVQPEDASLLYKWFSTGVLMWPLWSRILVWYLMILWILYQSSILSLILSPVRRNSMVTMITGAILVFLFPENNGIHPVLPALVFLLPGIIALLKASFVQKTRVYLFNAGLLISLASVVLYPVLIFFPFLLVAMLVLRLYSRNYFGVILTGLGIPWVYYLVLQWITGMYSDPGLNAVLGMYISNFLYFFPFLIRSLQIPQFFLTVLLALIVSISLLASMRSIDQQIISIRQQYKTLYLMLLPSALLLLISGGMFYHFLIFVTAAGIPLYSDLLLQSQKKKSTNAILWILMLIVVVFQMSMIL